MSDKSSSAAKLAAGLLIVFFTAMGWLTLLQGGITVKGKSGQTAFLDGNSGLIMAAFFFFTASLSLVILLKLGVKKQPIFISIACIWLPALVFIFT